MKRACLVVAVSLLSSGISFGAVNLNLSSDSGSLVIETGSTTTIPVDVYVTDTGADSLAGYDVGITLSSMGSAAGFKPGLGAPVDHTAIIADQVLGGGVNAGELEVSAYAPGVNEQYAVTNNGGLFSFDLVVPALGVGMYTLGFDPSETFLTDNSGLLPAGTFTGTSVTVVTAPEPASMPLLLAAGIALLANRWRTPTYCTPADAQLKGVQKSK